MLKQITLKIAADGQITAETHGIKGAACLSYVRILEQLTDAVPVDSAFTEEYREAEPLAISETEVETVCGR